MLRILTDRRTECCGCMGQHDYQLCLAINEIEHTKTKAHSLQTNGICERIHITILWGVSSLNSAKKLYS